MINDRKDGWHLKRLDTFPGMDDTLRLYGHSGNGIELWGILIRTFQPWILKLKLKIFPYDWILPNVSLTNYSVIVIDVTK